ncbi:MAG: tetratricopeptide repeat protein [Spirochaetota bacterium]|nr:tetratricopeptide repeat protein [Spirochaetota bacterium]
MFGTAKNKIKILSYLVMGLFFIFLIQCSKIDTGNGNRKLTINHAIKEFTLGNSVVERGNPFEQGVYISGWGKSKVATLKKVTSQRVSESFVTRSMESKAKNRKRVYKNTVTKKITRLKNKKLGRLKYNQPIERSVTLGGEEEKVEIKSEDESSSKKDEVSADGAEKSVQPVPPATEEKKDSPHTTEINKTETTSQEGMAPRGYPTVDSEIYEASESGNTIPDDGLGDKGRLGDENNEDTTSQPDDSSKDNKVTGRIGLDKDTPGEKDPKALIDKPPVDEGIAGVNFIEQLIDNAKKHYDKGELKEATEYLKKAINNSDPQPTSEQKSKINELLGQYNKAYAEKLYEIGKQQLDKGNYDEAIRYFNQATNLNPDHVLAYSYKGTAYYMKRDYNEALKASDEAIKRQADEPNAHFTKGEIYYGQRKDDQALSEYNNVINKDDKNAIAFFKLGVLKLLAGQNEESISLFDKALAVSPGLNQAYQRNAYYDRGVAKERLNKLDESIEDYKKAVELDDKYSKGYIQLGEAYYKKKSYDEASNTLNKGFSTSPKSYELAFLLAKTYDAQSESDSNKLGNALEYYNKALELNQSYEALYNAGRIHLKKNEVDQAVSNFEKASKIKENDYDLNTDYGTALYGQKKFDEAIQKYEKAVRIDDNLAGAHLGLGAVYFARSKKDDGSRNEDDLKKTVEHLEKAISKDPENYEVNRTLGTVYFILKRNDDSIKVLEKAIALKGDDLSTRRNIATAYYSNKNFDKAIPHYEKAIELKKEDDEELYLRLGECYFKTKDKENAKKWFNKLVEKYPENKNKRKIKFYLRAVGEDI